MQVLASCYSFLSWGAVEKLVLAIAEVESAVENAGAKDGCWADIQPLEPAMGGQWIAPDPLVLCTPQ